ncbi:Ig-like domain-containing protein [Pseudolysinimonas kribbensis]|uniref:Ig-like domain-containing protein n=1 Tax=Pseudolysinimonas kribbensis TaxID=433641 RepID=UPI0031D91AFA
MLRWLRGWSRARKAIGSTAVIAVAAGVPLTVAALYHGFPVSDVDLTQRDVWVTNSQQELAGRLNRQIDELDASVQATTASMDVVQSGRDVFLINRTAHTLERIDPAYTTLGQRADLPKNAEVALGGSTLAIVDPSNGALWSIDVSNQLSFDPATRHPDIKLGAGGHATVTPTGVVVATSPKNHEIVTVPRPGARPTTAGADIPVDNQISSVGEKAVVLEPGAKKLLVVGGPTVELPAPALKLQQASAAHGYAVLEGRDELMEVPLGGGTVTRIMAGIPDSSSGNGAIAPVWVDGCAHGAWGASQRYLLACDGRQPQKATIHQKTSGDELAFRVNGHVVALNNLDTGNVWVMADSLHLVDNWDEVTPPKEQQNDQIDKTKSSVESFEDTLAKRTNVNHPPTATPDTFGVRAGRTTVLPVLDNDTDPDGDVLVITDFTAIPDSLGHLDPIDGGRALQFTPAADAAGSASFRYTVSDGRPNGTADTTVDVHVVPPDRNSAPVSHRKAAVSVEDGQTITYNVLQDFRDPDGDDILLQNAAPASQDQVRFTPDGTLTFQSTSGQVGLKTVNFTVSDGRASTTGQLTVAVKPAGSLDPVGTPDFGQGFAGDTIKISPLQNDTSPSGQPLQLLGVKDVPGGATVTPNLDQGTVDVTSSRPGTVYFEYELGAGPSTSVGIVRADFAQRPQDAIPPVAVTDTAYLRQGQSSEVSVLDNDVSPTGKVLAVQSIDTSALDPGVKVEVLNNTIVRISDSASLTTQTQFTYTVSDGDASAVAGVTIVPVPPVVDRQPPIAVDDHATVRAGDIATVDVLDNDSSPDQAQLTLQPRLVDTHAAGDGVVFVSGDTLRYQAPKKPGVYSVVYRVADQYGEAADATVDLTVTAPDVKGDRAPVPDPQTARTFAGAKVRIDVPLNGIDPDGDSVTLVGYTSAPQLGRIVESASDHFTYEAYPTSAGTDSFRYSVQDALGKTAVGEVRIGVIPRAAESQPPNAVDDTVSVRPGKTIAVQPLLNDSDPNGYPITLEKKLTHIDKHLKAHTEGARVLIVAPKTQGSYNVGYRITNGQGGEDDAFIIVRVDKKAPLQPPTAEDRYISSEDLGKKAQYTVDVSRLIQNPNGENDVLKVSTVGPNAGLADVAGQRVTVHAQDHRVAIAYRVVDPDDPKLSAEAFIIVPPRVGSDYSPPPYLKPGTHPVVPQDGSKQWDLKDILVVPSGNPVTLAHPDQVAATGSDGSKLVVDKNTLRYAPRKGFRGQTAITFQVTDGPTATQPTGRVTLITMPLTVGNPDQSDVAPSFTAMTVQIEAGEPAREVDLRAATAHPNRSVVSQFRYGALTGGTDFIHGDLSGATLSVSSPLGTRVGTTADLHFTIAFRSFTVPGTVHVVTVPSTRPRAQAIEDDVKAQRAKATAPIDVLANDYNPFADQGKPLQLTRATVDNSAQTSAAVSFTPDGHVTVRPDASFIGVVSITYTVRDATGDASRDVTGRLLVTVRDVPSQIQPAPNVLSEKDHEVTIEWKIPATNGEPLLDYTIRWIGSDGGKSGEESVGTGSTRATVTGLVNGGHYQFTVFARNILGDGTPSAQSTVAIPFGTPTPPTTVTATPTNDGSGHVKLTWSGATGNGRDITTYTWRSNSGATGQSTTTSATARLAVGSNYTFTVTATNKGGLTSKPSVASKAAMPGVGAPSSPRLKTGADGDKTITATWGAATTYGTPVTYHVIINGDDKGVHSSGWQFNGNFGSNYTMVVRAVAGGSTHDSAKSNTVSPSDKKPAAQTVKGPEYNGYSGCPVNCYKVKVNYQDFPSGTYTLVIWDRDAGQSSGHSESPSFSAHMSGSGSVVLDYTFGTVGEHDEIWVHISGNGINMDATHSGAWG